MYSQRAESQLSKLDRSTARILVAWLNRHIDDSVDPRAHGKGLTGDRSAEWRYRVGDYRILCEIRDSELVVLAIEFGHRRDVYKR